MLQQTDFSSWTIAPSLHWMEAFGSWLHSTPSQKRRERSHLTRDAYLNDVRLLAEHFGNNWAPDLMNDKDLRAYFQKLEQESKPATYNRKLASVRMLIKWAREHGLMSDDPAAWIPFMDAVRKSPRDVSDEELLKLVSAAETGEDSFLGVRDSLIFFLMAYVGLRISEVIELKLSDLHLDDGYIHVLGKGKKHREPEVNSVVITKIRAWLAIKPTSLEGTLITDERGCAIDRGQAWRRFVLIAQRAGVRASPHWMRHTYIKRYMNAYMAGDPWEFSGAIDAVCQMTGDRSEVILKYYTRASRSRMRAAAEAM